GPLPLERLVPRLEPVQLAGPRLPEAHGVAGGLGIDRGLADQRALDEALGRRKLALLAQENLDRNAAGALGLGHGSSFSAQADRPRFLRATPVRMAASATAWDTAGTSRGSNMDGVMYSSLSSFLPTIPAIALAAASFISSFTCLARTSSRPRKMPGKPQELLI